MLKFKLFLFIMLFYFSFSAIAEENLLRIGGLDITPYNYGAIRIGSHENQDKSNARFANYYLELSTWVCATKNEKKLITDGDITQSKTSPDWHPFAQLTADTMQSDKETEIKYITVYHDNISSEKHQPLGITITQELYYQQYRDWAIICLKVKNTNNSKLKNLTIGFLLDADVPAKDNKPTAKDDMIGQSGNFLYIYDSYQTVKKSNIIGLLPLGKNINFNLNWWSIDQVPVNDTDRQQLAEISKNNLPASINDYRIMVTQGPFDLNKQQEVDIVFALIESKGQKNVLKAKEAAETYFTTTIEPGLKKMPHIATSNISKNIPDHYKLSQNYPNPFNPSTTISYTIPENNYIELTIYNIRGELVRRLVEANQNAGTYQAAWNGCNEAGKQVSSGVYYYQLKTEGFKTTKKMILFQ